MSAPHFIDTFDRATDEGLGQGWEQTAPPQIGDGIPADADTSWSATFTCGLCDFSITIDGVTGKAELPQEYSDHVASHR